MNFKLLLGALAASVILLLGAVLFLGGGAPSQAPLHSAENGTEARVDSASKGLTSTPESAGAQKSVDTASPAPESAGIPQSEKDAVLLKLFDVSYTPTEESVNFAEGYLFSPDLEVRNAAIEAMKQISTPAAAGALRDAASRATSPADKAAFLKAAEFTELPAYVPQNQRPAATN